MKYGVFCFLTILFLSLIFSCARQTAPTGGPQDTIPPKVIASIPSKNQTNYKSNTIELQFNEYVNINNPREQLIITPSVGKDVEMIARKNRAILTINSPLKDSTTYTINFRESIHDITERNPAENLKLAFSTGTYIDSLYITGIVYDLLTGKENKDITVALYQSDTFNIFKHPAYFFTKGNDKGNFIIENLKAGKYFIYAFYDKNKNLIVDSKTETYGFLSQAIDLQPNQEKTEVKIPMIKLDARELKLTSKRPYNTYFVIKASKNLKEYSIKSQSPESIFLSTYGADKATINVYQVKSPYDSVLLSFSAKDSIGNSIDTSFYFKLNQRKATPEKATFSIHEPKVLINTSEFTGTVNFSKPVIWVNYDSILFKVDSLNTIHFSEEDLTWDYTKGNFSIRKKIDKSLYKKETDVEGSFLDQSLKKTPMKKNVKSNLLYLGKGALVTLEKDSISRMTEQVTIYHPEDLSTLSVNIETQEKNFIVQLLTKQFEVIRSHANKSTIVFDNLLPGEYQIRLIIDNNSNGVWDGGNYNTKTEPEPITYYKSEKGLQVINLKANWELGPLLITY